MKKSPALRRFKIDNKGSAIITVVIAMLFVIALGTALLFTAYMGTQVSVSSRSEKVSFYNASTALDEIKAGIQDEVSASLQLAYTTALVSYGKGANSAATIQDYLENEFFRELGAYSVVYKNNTVWQGAFDTVAGADGTPQSLMLDVSRLKTNYITTGGVTVSVTGEKNGVLSFSADGETDKLTKDGELTIPGLKVCYTSDKGYYSEVSTDLVISIPDFFTGASVAPELGEYAIIADTGIVGQGGTRTVSGGVYAGPNGICTTANGAKLVLTNGNIFSAGAVRAAASSTIELGNGSYEIWAQEFVADTLSTLKLNGSIFVRDDLVINGGTNVTLSGSYYGFGTNDATPGKNNDSLSSSININGYSAKKINPGTAEEYTQNVDLDLKNLDQLILGGVSFINTTKASKDDKGNDTTAGAVSGNVANLPTGQSVAVKTDQLAYLVPAEAVTNYKTNPAWVKQGEEIAAPTYNNKAFLWEIGGASRNLAYYLGIPAFVTDGEGKSVDNSAASSGKDGSIVAYYTPSANGERTVYFFLSFTNQDKANEYFRDYFTARPDSISQYLDIYLKLGGNPQMTTITKGSSYAYQNEKWSVLSGTFSTAQSNLAERYYDYYKAESGSRYGSYVNAEAVAKLNGATLKFKNGTDTVAVVADGNYTYSSSEPGTIRYIISSGNVTINKAFSGTIIAKGTVTVNDDVSGLVDATAGEAVSGSYKFSDFTSGLFGGSMKEKDNHWSPDKLVYYENWQKN